MMKNDKTGLLIALSLIPMVIVIAAMPFLPEEVAIHYGLDGADAFGSKWQLLLVPGLMCTICDFVILGIYSYSKKSKGDFFCDREKKPSPITCIGFIALFDVVTAALIFLNFA